MRADRLRPGQPGGLAEADVGGRRGAHFELPDRDRVLGLERIALGTASQQPAAAPGGFGPPRGHHVEHGHPDRQEVGVLLHDLRGDAVALPDQTQQDVLGADVVVMQLERLTQRELEGLLRPRRERDVPARRVGPGADHGPDFFTRVVARYPEAGQDAAGVPLGLAEQTEQNVLGADVVVMQLPRFLLGKHDGVPGSVRESLKHETKGAAPFTPRQYHANNRAGACGSNAEEGGIVEWEDRLDEWELELELAARLEDSDWVPLERAAAETGASRAALRSWYRTGQIPSRLVDGPHAPRPRHGCAAARNGGSPMRPSSRSSGTASTSSSCGWPRWSCSSGRRPV